MYHLLDEENNINDIYHNLNEINSFEAMLHGVYDINKNSAEEKSTQQARKFVDYW